MNRVTHFEIPADDAKRAMAFYEGVFGWEFNKWGDEEHWLIQTGEGKGIDGGLMPKKHPEQPMTNVVEVADIEAMTASVAASGGEIVVPKMAIAGVGYLVYFKDTEGNIMGMMQVDPAAA